ncbi:MAG: GGDEF domain-containing phosphodiesterase [Clostridia bacterium]
MNNDYTFEIAIDDYLKAIALEDMEEAMNAFLEILGKYYGAEKTYLFQVNNATTEVKTAYFWTRNDNIEKKSNIKGFENNETSETILQYFNNSKENKISHLIINDFEKDSLEYKFLKKYKLDNVISYAVFNSTDEAVGFIGISNGDTNREIDTRLILAISKYIEQNLKNIIIENNLISTKERDTLTGFYSRKKYALDIERLMQEEHKSIGIIFININGLKKVNDNLGYKAGDDYILKCSKLIKNNIEETVYRISGDEFVVILHDVTEEELLEKVFKLREAKKLLGEMIFAVGQAYKSGGTINILHLISDADNVMYINKQQYYQQVHNETHQEVSNELLNDLMFAVDNEEFLVYLQPKINLEDGSIVGAEALVRRFSKKENKMIFPDQFIPLYEKNSIIRHVDICVLTTVCKLLSEWKKYDRQFPISVNLSRVTLLEHNIVETICDICDKYGVDHKYILIEITERIGLVENNIASKLINDFKEKGFSLSLDDFGCAYSNIVTLAKIDVDEVKIDKSLIDDLLINSKNRIIVENVLKMCSSFENTHAIAEGIEIIEQADVLKEFGCLYGQGYYYSRPVPNEEFFEKYIKV